MNPLFILLIGWVLSLVLHELGHYVVLYYSGAKVWVNLKWRDFGIDYVLDDPVMECIALIAGLAGGGLVWLILGSWNAFYWIGAVMYGYGCYDDVWVLCNLFPEVW